MRITVEPAEKTTESEIEEEEAIEADSDESLERFSRENISIAQRRAPQWLSAIMVNTPKCDETNVYYRGP